MQTIMFNSEKGGTGKTELSTLTAAFMAVIGARVLVVDLDAQAHATIRFGLPKAPGLYDVLVRDGDVLDHIVRAEQAAYCPAGKAPAGALYVLPGNFETGMIANSPIEKDALADMLDDVSGLIDVCIIDTAPSAGALLAFAHIAADYVVVPTQLEFLSLDGLIGTIRAAGRSGVELLGIVPNRVKHTALHEMYYEDLQGAAAENDWHLFGKIYDRIGWAEASSMQQIIYTFDNEMSKARIEGIRLAREIAVKVGVYV